MWHDSKEWMLVLLYGTNGFDEQSINEMYVFVWNHGNLSILSEQSVCWEKDPRMNPEVFQLQKIVTLESTKVETIALSSDLFWR